MTGPLHRGQVAPELGTVDPSPVDAIPTDGTDRPATPTATVRLGFGLWLGLSTLCQIVNDNEVGSIWVDRDRALPAPGQVP